MSLVGTRPILQDELRQYELHHRARIAIKPGIFYNTVGGVLGGMCYWGIIKIKKGL